MSFKKKLKTNTNEDLLNDGLKDILKEVPKEKREVVRKRLAIVSSHSGPLPPPRVLEEYNNIVPKGAERIMKMAEMQMDHRIKMERIVIRRQLNQSGIGQVCALVVALTALGIACYLAINGHDTVAGIIGGTTVVG